MKKLVLILFSVICVPVLFSASAWAPSWDRETGMHPGLYIEYLSDGSGAGNKVSNEISQERVKAIVGYYGGGVRGRFTQFVYYSTLGDGRVFTGTTFDQLVQLESALSEGRELLEIEGIAELREEWSRWKAYMHVGPTPKGQRLKLVVNFDSYDEALSASEYDGFGKSPWQSPDTLRYCAKDVIGSGIKYFCCCRGSASNRMRFIRWLGGYAPGASKPSASKED